MRLLPRTSRATRGHRKTPIDAPIYLPAGALSEGEADSRGSPPGRGSQAVRESSGCQRLVQFRITGIGGGSGLRNTGIRKRRRSSPRNGIQQGSTRGTQARSVFVLSEIAGFVSRILFSSRPGRDGIAAAAFVFEGTAARAGGVATHVGEARGHRKAGRDRRCIGDLVQLEVAVEAVALPLR